MSDRTLRSMMDELDREMIEGCTACGMCVTACAVNKDSLMPDGPASAMESLLAALRDGDFSREAYLLAQSCSHCRLCRAVCPQGLKPDLMMTMAMAHMVRGGMPVPEQFKPYESGPYRVVDLLNAMQMEPGQQRWLSRVPAHPPQVDVVAFLGCMGNAVPHQLESVVDVLGAMKLDFVAVAGGELCCGIPSLAFGDYEQCQEKGAELVAALAAFRPKTVVFCCTACYTHTMHTMSQVIDVPFSGQHILHFLRDNLHRLKFVNPVAKVVTYHDSCELGRGLKEFETPRDLIRAIPGVRFVEMEHNRERGICCSVGGTMYMNPEAGRALRRSRLREAADVGAEILVTPCRGCLQSLSAGGREYGLEVLDYVTLIAKALGFEYENRLPELLTRRGELRLSEDERRRFGDLDVAQVEDVLTSYLSKLAI